MHLAGIYVAGKFLTENYISAVPGVKVANCGDIYII